MAPNGLYPAYIRVDYHSAYAPHVSLLPLLNWSPVDITGTLGSCLGHTGSPVDTESMVNALLDFVKVFHLATTSFDRATVYTIADPDAPQAVPQRSVALTTVGTSTNPAQAKAVQNVFTFRTAAVGIFKLYLLDAPTIGGAFAKVPISSWNTDMANVLGELGLSTNAWCGRDNAQIMTGISVTSTMNEKLRKEYRMT